MRRELIIKSGNLAGTSDFRVLAPITKGFVPALDAITYKTRVKRVLRTLHVGRGGAHESELARVLSDAVERVGRIHSVGIAVLEPEDKVLLTVTFDGAWEAYVRVIWQKVSRLLDLIFCNTDNYVLGWENSYEKWGIWLKQAQSEASFLYATPGLTVDDTRYLTMQERVSRRESGDAADARVTRIKIPTPEEISRQMIFGDGGAVGVDPTNAGLGEKLTVQDAGRPPFRHGVRSLVGLYRLADVYLPETKDGEILHRAAQELLPEFLEMLGRGTYETGVQRALRRFEEPMLWFKDKSYPEPEVRQGLMKEPPDEQPLPDPDNVQGGILTGYPEVDHGCLLMLGFETPKALAALLEDLPLTSAAQPLEAGQIATNIAFTVEGLRLAGLSDDDIRALPEEFVQGMERRAGLLGDLRINHPRRWRLPALNWHLGEAAPDAGDEDCVPRIDLGSVHAVVQVRMRSDGAEPSPRSRLMSVLKKLVATHSGVKPLSLQWMQRNRHNDRFQDHFGFVDNKSDPVFSKSEAGTRFRNHIHLGEMLCGYPNRADKTGAFNEAPERIRSLLHDGSFLVIRKLRQDVEALEQSLQGAVQQTAAGGHPLSREQLLAKMMGRWPGSDPKAGQPLAQVLGPDPLSNDFHFDQDKQGALCPLHAHIRRSNPRNRSPEPGSRPPRIVRRGMSYGAAYDPAATDPAAGASQERGLIFMAYNANLGEQFEVVQSWLSGGNSAGSFSGQSDPFVGLAEPGRRRYFRFENDGKTVRAALDGSDRLHDEPRPFVRLEWGAYLLAPSRQALASLQRLAAAQGPKRSVTWSAETGEREIACLRELEARQGSAAAIAAWKSALEDPDAAADFTTASIWAAIRERHGGVLKTPFGVLVADRDMVQQVLADRERRLTITAYLPRMRRSFGVLYLGLDPDQDDRAYERESEICNTAIMALDRQYSFERARTSTREALQRLVDMAIEDAREDAESRWELTLDARELIDPLLADFCEEWFGLSEQDGHFRRSGHRWDWTSNDPPNYPGHFLSPSRYIFQPHPGPDVEAIGAAHGVSVRDAMIQFLGQFRAEIAAPVTRAVLDSPQGSADVGFAARTIAGAMMGFIPTVEGNLRRILNEWLRENTLWSLRARLAGSAAADFTDACNRLGNDFIPAMQLRAVPELIWRTATVSHSLGEGPHRVTVMPGDIVVAGAVSATQQLLQDGRQELYDAFGGNRRVAGHPTHACPGADPALAVMLGFFSALVESELPLRPGPGPLTFALEGRLPPVAEALRQRSFLAVDLATEFDLLATAKAQLAATATPLLAIGDSWLFDQWQRDFGVVRANLTSSLLKLGYKDSASNDFNFVATGRPLREMAKPQFLNSVTNYLADEPGLKAIILGGGGNDVVDGFSTNKPLYKMLNPRAAGQPALNETAMADFIDGTLFNYYRTIVRALTDNTSIPILIHAYDHPIPDGRGDLIIIFRVGPWLQPVFAQRGYDLPNNAAHLAMATDVMRTLIDRLNAMVARVAAETPAQVHHVKLTGTFANAAPGEPSTVNFWANELHANATGCDLLAEVIVKKLKELNI